MEVQTGCDFWLAHVVTSSGSEIFTQDSRSLSFAACKTLEFPVILNQECMRDPGLSPYLPGYFYCQPEEIASPCLWLHCNRSIRWTEYLLTTSKGELYLGPCTAISDCGTVPPATLSPENERPSVIKQERSRVGEEHIQLWFLCHWWFRCSCVSQSTFQFFFFFFLMHLWHRGFGFSYLFLIRSRRGNILWMHLNKWSCINNCHRKIWEISFQLFLVNCSSWLITDW